MASLQPLWSNELVCFPDSAQGIDTRRTSEEMLNQFTKQVSASEIFVVIFGASPQFICWLYVGYMLDMWYGYGSIPIDTIFRMMNIHKSQLFWCELQGYKVLTHCHIPPLETMLDVGDLHFCYWIFI